MTKAEQGPNGRGASNPTGMIPDAFLRNALEYARLGLRALPLHERDKVPRQRDWPSKATSDPKKIRRWPASWRTGNLGIASGQGLVVLDIDPRKGGDASLAELIAQYGPLPQTSTAITGSGGRHFLFHYPPELGLRNRLSWRPGLDVLADGGQFVVAPSVHPVTGRAYTWSSHPREGIAEAPDWLLEALSPPDEGITRREPAGRRIAIRPGRMGEIPRLADEVIRKFPVAGPGMRHRLMVRVVGSLMGRNFSTSLVRAVAMRWWEHFHQLGRTRTSRSEMEAELEACIQSTGANPKFRAATSQIDHTGLCAGITLEPWQRLAIEFGDIEQFGSSNPVPPSVATLHPNLRPVLSGDQGEQAERTSPQTSLPCMSGTSIKNRLCQTEEEKVFVEALIVHVTHKRLHTDEVGPILMTYAQVREIASARHPLASDGPKWVTRQLGRLMDKFVTRPGKPASRLELLRRTREGRPGTPSEYETTGLEQLLIPPARKPSEPVHQPEALPLQAA